MGVTSGIAVVAGNLSGAVDAPGRGAGGERKVDRGEAAGLKQKAMGARGVRPTPNNIAGGVDPSCSCAGSPGEVDGREDAAAAEEPMLDVGCVETVAYDLPGIVDANRLRQISAGKLNIAEAAATVGETAPHTRQVVVDTNDQTEAIEACRDANGRVRDGQNLVYPAHESECSETSVPPSNWNPPTASLPPPSKTQELDAPG